MFTYYPCQAPPIQRCWELDPCCCYAPVSDLATEGYYYSPSPAMDTPMFTYHPSKGNIAGYLYVFLLTQPFLGLPYTGYDRKHESNGLGLPTPPPKH